MKKTPPFFLYSQGGKLSAGAAQYGFLGDGTQSNRIPYLATGAWGQVNTRQIRSQGVSNVATTPGFPVYTVPPTIQAPGFSQLINGAPPSTLPSVLPSVQPATGTNPALSGLPSLPA
jgi:hypothetical protein